MYLPFYRVFFAVFLTSRLFESFSEVFRNTTNIFGKQKKPQLIFPGKKAVRGPSQLTLKDPCIKLHSVDSFHINDSEFRCIPEMQIANPFLEKA